MTSALRGFGPFLQDSTPASITYDTIMTALHIRKNTAELLKITASAVEHAKVPTKAGIKQKLNMCRVIAAAIIIPNDAAFSVQPKQGN